MTRVLLSSDHFWPNIGGVEVLAAKLVDSLGERGHEFSVLAQADPNLPEEDSYHGVPIHRLPFLEAATGRDPELTLRVRKSVAELKRSFAPDVVHIYHANFNALFHLMTTSVHAVPTLVTVHGEFPDSVMSPGGMLHRLLLSSSWVTACSEASLARTRGQVPEITARSSVVSNALEVPALEATPLQFGEPRLVCVGRLRTNEKAFDVAIAAMPTILARYPRSRLVIAGDGPIRADLLRQAEELGVRDHVDLRGWVRPQSIAALMNEATIVLMPSRIAEGFGLVALQAAQMSRPVVATRVGGLPEVVVHGETGLLVEPEDIAGLATAVISLLDDPVLAAGMGQVAADRAKRLFAWPAHVDAYDGLVRSLTRQPRVPVVT